MKHTHFILISSQPVISLTLTNTNCILMKNEKKLARSFNFTLYYTDDVFSLNNSKLGDFVDHIYPTLVFVASPLSMQQ
jgi:hypothetical protein